MAKKLNIEQQLLVNAAADEILESSTIHQQAVVRMLAVASEHRLNAAHLMEDLQVEMRSATARDVSELVYEIMSGVPLESALAHVPGIVPEPVILAFATAQSQGLQAPLNQALLNGPAIRRSERDHSQDVSIASKLMGLFWRYVFCFQILTFVMFFIIPQFKDMFLEFGVDLPFSMILLINVCNKVVQLWFVFPLILITILVLAIYTKPQFFISYFTRWIPNRWQQPVLTKNARKDRSLAWVVQSSDLASDVAVRFVSGNEIGVAKKRRLAAAEKLESGADVMETLTSERVVSRRVSRVAEAASSKESAGWILRKASEARELRSHGRSLTGINCFIWMGNFLLLFLGGWFAISIVQSLLSVIRGVV